MRENRSPHNFITSVNYNVMTSRVTSHVYSALHELLQCMHDVIAPCSAHSQELESFYALMVHHMDPVCGTQDFALSYNTTFAAQVEDFIGKYSCKVTS